MEDNKVDEMEDKITYKECVDLGKKQWEMAMNGDVRMLIWLGKQYLGQVDSPVIVAEKEELCEGFDLDEIPEDAEIQS